MDKFPLYYREFLRKHIALEMNIGEWMILSSQNGIRGKEYRDLLENRLEFFDKKRKLWRMKRNGNPKQSAG